MSAVITHPTSRFGTYAVDTQLGAGGQSAVYLARSVSPDNGATAWVVVKTPKTPGNPAGMAALAKEARALELVDHPNIVRLFATHLDAEPAYLVLEYVPGVDLHRLLQLSLPNDKGVPAELACLLCHRVALALTALHEPSKPDVPRIFHGDVSPSNILLSDHGQVKLGDFGLARTTGGPPSSTARPTNPPPGNAAWGHRRYLAPERLDGGEPSEAGDVFGLGVVLAELLTGGPVFTGQDEIARMVSAKQGDIGPLLQRADALPRELLELCQRCLSPASEERPTAYEVALVLQRRVASNATTEQQLTRSLSAWVSWAKQQPRHTEEQVRQSLRVLRAARAISGPMRVTDDDGRALLRPAGAQASQSVSYSELVALAASGKLDGSDEVALFGDDFEPVSRIPALARHVRPSSSALTSKVSPLGPADYCVELGETPLVDLIGRLTSERATGLLMVERETHGQTQRKDVYVHEGRMTYVSSVEPNENNRLGESLVNAGLLTRQELSAALRHMVHTHGQLGESLVALQFVDPVVVYQALCSQGRERVVAACGWQSGLARFFRGVKRPEVAFPLDVDLHACLVQAIDANRRPLPDAQRRIVPLATCPPPRSTPSTLPLLNLVPSIARKRITVGTAMEELSLLSARGVTTNPSTYLLTARLLGWVDFV